MSINQIILCDGETNPIRKSKNRIEKTFVFDGVEVVINNNTTPSKKLIAVSKNANKQLTAKLAAADRLRAKLEARQSKEIK